MKVFCVFQHRFNGCDTWTTFLSVHTTEEGAKNYVDMLEQRSIELGDWDVEYYYTEEELQP